MITMVTRVENVEQREEGLREHYGIRREARFVKHIWFTGVLKQLYTYYIIILHLSLLGDKKMIKYVQNPQP